MKRLPALILALLVAVLHGGCGDPPQPTLEQLLLKLDDKEPRVADAAAEMLGRRGRADPAGVVPLIVARLEAEHARSRVLAVRVVPDLSGVAPGERAGHLQRLSRHVGMRVDRAGFPGVQVRHEGEAIEVFVAPPQDASLTPTLLEELLRAVREPGGFALRAEVPAPFVVTPDRPVSPWPGDAADHAAWLDAERTRYGPLAGGGAGYAPSRPGFRLVPVEPGMEAGEERLVPLAEPQAPLLDMNDAALDVDVGQDRAGGVPAVRVYARAEQRQAMLDFLATCRGLRLWIVAGGRALLPTRVLAAPDNLLHFPVYGATLEGARQRALAVGSRLSLRAYPVPLTVAALERPTLVSLDSPAARALAGVGLAAEPALDALEAKDPSWRPFVQKMRDALVRTETGLGR